MVDDGRHTSPSPSVHHGFASLCDTLVDKSAGILDGILSNLCQLPYDISSSNPVHLCEELELQARVWVTRPVSQNPLPRSLDVHPVMIRFPSRWRLSRLIRLPLTPILILLSWRLIRLSWAGGRAGRLIRHLLGRWPGLLGWWLVRPWCLCWPLDGGDILYGEVLQDVCFCFVVLVFVFVCSFLVCCSVLIFCCCLC